MKLLLLRIVPLFLRPLAIYLEGALLTHAVTLVTALPIVMIALAASSVPVHIPMYKLRGGDPALKQYQEDYLGALLIIIVVSLLVLFAFTASLPPYLEIAIGLLFLIEKLADETSRYLEFEKRFVAWFVVQSFRSGWPVIAIGAAAVIGRYNAIFLLMEVVTICLLMVTFRHLIPALPRVSLARLPLIFAKAPYMVGGLLPAVFRNVPRLLVVRIFPTVAHTYVAIAQVAQSISILFDLRFNLPYRKLIAQKPVLYFRRMAHPTWFFTAVACAGGLALLILWSLIPGEAGWQVYLFGLLLIESSLFSLVAITLAIVPWCFPIRTATLLYFGLLGLYALAGAGVAVLWQGSGMIDMKALDIPYFTISIALIWLVAARKYIGAKVR